VLFRVVLKELIQLRQDRKMIPVLVATPLLQLLALGYAANTDVNDVRFLLVDVDHTRASRELVERFTGSGIFRLVGTEETVRGVDRWLLEGRADMALVIGAGYGKEAASGGPPEIQVLTDGSDANSATLGLGYAARIVAADQAERIGRLLSERIRDRPPGAVAAPGPASIRLDSRVWYNPDLKSRWFYVPAILAMVLMLTTMILPSMAVVREREIGTLEQILVTPMRPWQLIVGKLLPFAAIGVLDLFLITGLVVFLFGVPLRGSVGALLILTLPFLLTTLGLGLLMSTHVANQQQAMMGSIFFLMVPMIYLSGLIFPIENMPAAMQAITYAVPLRYYNNVIRGVFLKGSGYAVLWPDFLILTGFGVLSLALASFRFRKRLD
jgi:ABC-2 type transport system permease protein